MEKIEQTNFQKWFQNQFRLAGEELIRRSQQMTFLNWDLISGAKIIIDMPHYNGEAIAPTLHIDFDLIPKMMWDEIAEHGFVTD